MLWQMNKIKHRRLLQRHHPPRRAVKAVPRAEDTAVMVALAATAAAVAVAKVVPAAVAADVAKVAPPAAQADLAAASANFSVRRKSANFVSKRWTSSTTSAPTFFPNSCRNAAKFCPAA